MSKEDVKVGETYNVRVKVECIDEDGWFKVRTSEKAISFVLSPKEQEAFSPLPKYDPCRLFREGDIVTPKERNGRIPWGKDTKLIVVADETMAGVTVRDEESGEERFICALFLELVTPVEELEPYFVGESENSYDLFRKTSNGNQLRASFWWKHNPTPDLIELSTANAKAAAEAERDRLNAEYRKEQK